MKHVGDVECGPSVDSLCGSQTVTILPLEYSVQSLHVEPSDDPHLTSLTWSTGPLFTVILCRYSSGEGFPDSENIVGVIFQFFTRFGFDFDFCMSFDM